MVHLAFFIPDLSAGGVARVILNLAAALARRGHRVDLVLCRAAGPYLEQVPADVNVVGLSGSPFGLGRAYSVGAEPKAFAALLLPVVLPRKPSRTVPYLPALVRYVRREKPAVLFSAKTHANLTALWTRRLVGGPMRVVISEHSHLSQNMNEKRKWRWRFIVPVVRRAYPWADAIVAVSDGVADDLSQRAGIARERLTTIYNPVVAPDLHTKAHAPLDHPWFQPDAPPVVLGTGRLVPQKDFPTLLRAFARVRARRPARLMILGEGKLRAELEALASTLGIAADVTLPGFVENPYAYMTRAAGFVLSSAWEGLSNAVIEALACGCPVVSTDCPSGPAEILDGGTYGRLVSVGDDAALAEAIVASLDQPLAPERLRDRARLFSVDHAVERYLNVLLGD